MTGSSHFTPQLINILFTPSFFLMFSVIDGKTAVTGSSTFIEMDASPLQQMPPHSSPGSENNS